MHLSTLALLVLITGTAYGEEFASAAPAPRGSVKLDVTGSAPIDTTGVEEVLPDPYGFLILRTASGPPGAQTLTPVSRTGIPVSARTAHFPLPGPLDSYNPDHTYISTSVVSPLRMEFYDHQSKSTSSPNPADGGETVGMDIFAGQEVDGARSSQSGYLGHGQWSQSYSYSADAIGVITPECQLGYVSLQVETPPGQCHLRYTSGQLSTAALLSTTQYWSAALYAAGSSRKPGVLAVGAGVLDDGGVWPYNRIFHISEGSVTVEPYPYRQARPVCVAGSATGEIITLGELSQSNQIAAWSSRDGLTTLEANGGTISDMISWFDDAGNYIAFSRTNSNDSRSPLIIQRSASGVWRTTKMWSFAGSKSFQIVYDPRTLYGTPRLVILEPAFQTYPSTPSRISLVTLADDQWTSEVVVPDVDGIDYTNVRAGLTAESFMILYQQQPSNTKAASATWFMYEAPSLTAASGGTWSMYQ